MIDTARAHDAVPAFEVTPSVPGKRADAVADLEAVLLEALGDPERAAAHFAVIRRVDRAFHRAADHRPVRMMDRGVVDDAVAKQRPLLHEALHEFPPRTSCALRA
jgi:hypothetical protein